MPACVATSVPPNPLSCVRGDRIAAFVGACHPSASMAFIVSVTIDSLTPFFFLLFLSPFSPVISLDAVLSVPLHVQATLPAQLFMQWYNQSYNMAVNYVRMYVVFFQEPFCPSGSLEKSKAVPFKRSAKESLCSMEPCAH